MLVLIYAAEPGGKLIFLGNLKRVAFSGFGNNLPAVEMNFAFQPFQTFPRISLTDTQFLRQLGCGKITESGNGIEKLQILCVHTVSQPLSISF